MPWQNIHEGTSVLRPRRALQTACVFCDVRNMISKHPSYMHNAMSIFM